MSLFFLTQIIGLVIIDKNIETFGREILQPEEDQEREVLVSIPLSIIILSVFFLVFQKLGWKKILLLWYFLAFITTVYLSTSAFIPNIHAVILAIILLIIRYNSDDNYIHNLSELLVYGGLAVAFLPILNTRIMIILLIIISIYDIFSVFYSKHMISLAKSQEELNIFSGLKVKINDRVAMLGGGDLAFPLMFASVVFRDYGTLPSISIIYGSMIGLLTLILLTRKNRFYPAMPLISLGSFLGYSITFLA